LEYPMHYTDIWITLDIRSGVMQVERVRAASYNLG